MFYVCLYLCPSGVYFIGWVFRVYARKTFLYNSRGNELIFCSICERKEENSFKSTKTCVKKCLKV